VEDPKIIKREVEKFKKLKKLAPASPGGVFVLSLFDDKMLKKLRDELVKILKKK